MSNFYSVLGEDNIGQEGEQKLVDFFHFKSLMPNVKVLLPNSNFQQNKNKTSSSLLECSSKYGYFVAGSCSGIVLGQTAKLRSKVHAASKTETVSFGEIISVDIRDGEVNIIALSADQLQLFVGVSGGLLLTYNVYDIIKDRENAVPVQSQSMGSEITFIKPNPEVYPDILAVCTKNHELRLVRYMQKQVVSTIYNVTSLCWSPKGKQIMCGTKDGTLYAYDIEGNPKDEIATPPAIESDHYVNAILWIENHVFLTVYANSKNEEHTHTAYMVDRRQPEDKRYVLLDEINPIFDIDAPNSYFYMSTLHNMGPDIKTLIVIANAGTNELAVVGQGDDGAWATWMLDEASMPRLPLSEDDVSDTYPVGLAFDLSATEPLDPYDAAESETPVPAMPVLYFLTNEGSICAYHAYNDELAKLGGCYADMVEAQSVNQIPAPSAPSSVPFSELKTSSSAPTSSEHKSSFGNIATKIPSFTSMTTSKSATTQPTTSLPFASLSSEGPKFGTTSSIGLGVGASSPSQKQGVPFSSLSRSSSSETKLPTALVSSSSSSAPAFGSTTSFGAGNGTPTFGSTTAFGAGGFGSAGTFKTAAPSFGGFKNAMSSPQKPFGDVSFKTGSDTTPSKFAPSILDANEDEEKKTSSEEKEKSIETEKSTSEFAPSTLDANDEEKKKKSTTEEKSTSKFAPSTLDAKDDEKTTESKKNSPTFAPSILDDTDNEKKQAAEDGAPSTLKANKESETEMKASNDQVEDLKEVTGDAQLTDNENTDDNVPSKKSTPVEPTSCSLSFEELQKTLEEDDTGSDISKISSIHDSGDDNSENDSYSRNESSDDKEEAKKEEKQDLEEEKKILAEEKRIKDEKRLAEEKRIEEEKRIAQEKRLVEEKRKVAERIAEEKRKDAERVAEEKQLEAEKIAEEKRLEAEIAEKERVEAERIAEERLQAERLAAIKPDPLFAVREPEQYETTNYKRTPVILPMAKDFEELYFSTLEEMESTHFVISSIKDEFTFQKRTVFALKDTSYLDDLDFVWKLSDNKDIGDMMDTLIQEAKEADIHLKQPQKLFDSLCESSDRSAVKKDILVSCIDTKQVEEALKDVDVDNEIVSQYNELEAKTIETEKTLEELQNKLNECKSEIVPKSTATTQSNLTLYTLRRTARDIERTIAKEKAKLMAMEEEELSLHKKEENSSTSISDSSSAAKVALSKAPRRRVPSKNPFLNLVFQGIKQPLHA